MKKPILATFLALCMALTLLPGAALAAEVDSGSCGENVTWSLDDAGTLTISGTGPMEDYTYLATESPSWQEYKGSIKAIRIQNGVSSIGSWAFRDCTNLTSVVIPDSVTSIGANAFSLCSSLPEIAIPDTVSSIGGRAFESCSALARVNIPRGMTKIENSVFSSCSSLTSLTIPENITSIGEYAFSFCTELKNIVIPAGLTELKSGAFNNCHSLEKVIIPEGITSIEDWTFVGCRALTDLVIPSKVTSIEMYAVEGCTSLKRVTIPVGVTEIPSLVFDGCVNLTDVNYSGTKAQWKQVTIKTGNDPLLAAAIHCTDGDILPESSGDSDVIASGECGAQGDNVTWTLYDTGTFTINGAGAMYGPEPGGSFRDLWQEYRTQIKEVIIENGVTSIGGHAFGDCVNLTNVVIPSSVASIDEAAFYGCTGLKNIEIPKGVASIGTIAFRGCTNLTDVVIPESVTRIDNTAFCDCTRLNSVKILGRVTKIESEMFRSCSNLTSVTLQNSVTEIIHGAFAECGKLTDVYYSGTKAQWGQINIDQNDNSCLLAATIHCTDGDIVPEGEVPPESTIQWSLKDGVLTISGTGAMDDYAVFEEIPVPQHREYTTLEALYDAPWADRWDEIEKVIINEGITAIGDSAFTGYPNLVSVEMPDSLTSIGDAAFDACDSLPSIRVPANVSQIGTYAFGCGDVLKEILVDEKNPYFCSVDGVLYTKDKTTLVQYPAGLSGTFRILDGTKTIGAWAFDSCDQMTELVVPKSVTAMEEVAFFSCTSLEKLFYGGSEEDWEKTAMDESVKYALENVTIYFNAGSADEYLTLPNGVKYLPYAYGELFERDIYTIEDFPSEPGDYSYETMPSLEWEGFPWVEFPHPYTFVSAYIDNDFVSTSPGSPRSGSLYIKPSFVSHGAGVHVLTINLEDDNGQPVVYNLTYHILDPKEKFELLDPLPQGLLLNPDTAEIYGVPTVDGKWNFRVRCIGGSRDGEVRSCSLTIEKNEDTTVKRPNDYPIIIPVGRPDSGQPDHFRKTSYAEETLLIDGPYDEFSRLLIDGVEQKPDEDYTAKEGSTAITIRSQTFQKIGKGTHTIAAEFRDGGDPSGDLKCVAQNYTLSISSGSSNSGSGTPGTIVSNSGGRGMVTKPPVQKPKPVEEKEEPGLPFTDVSPSDWFYDDLMWAYENGVMQGVSGTEFAPKREVSQATIVTVLARLAKADLTRFEDAEEPDIQPGQQYTTAAIWAKRAGLFPEEGTFTGDKTTTRNQMAVMLTRYLNSVGTDTSAPEDGVEFADAADMTQEGNNAFQVLYHYGIFNGVGGLRMNASGSTTRAHFVALIHRLSVFANE